jgi:hypothetical protein
LRPKPQTPGSDIKPAIPRAIFTPKVPNLKPAQDRALKGDVFKSSGQPSFGRDRGSDRFESPIKGDRPPYNNPTRTIRAVSPKPSFNPNYNAPSYIPSYKDNSLPSTIYEVPQTSRAIIIQKDFERDLNPERIGDGNPSFLPPRPDRDRSSTRRQQRRAERRDAAGPDLTRRGARQEVRQQRLADQPRRGPRAEQGPQRDRQVPRDKGSLASAETVHNEYIIAMAHEDPAIILAAKQQSSKGSENQEIAKTGFISNQADWQKSQKNKKKAAPEQQMSGQRDSKNRNLRPTQSGSSGFTPSTVIPVDPNKFPVKSTPSQPNRPENLRITNPTPSVQPPPSAPPVQQYSPAVNTSGRVYETRSERDRRERQEGGYRVIHREQRQQPKESEEERYQRERTENRYKNIRTYR